MSEICRFNRVVLKLSGEALKGEDQSGLNAEAIDKVSNQIAQMQSRQIETAVVVGGGNFLRGVSVAGTGLTRNTADMMGMMGTVMNALALRDALVNGGKEASLQTPFPMPGIAEAFDAVRARRKLAAGEILLLAGGTGHPYFTTDTTAALRACELEADAVLKATKVDGVYSEDPARVKTATRFLHISYEDALKKDVAVMDATAFSLCRENNLPVIVFNFAAPDSIKKVLDGDLSQATLVSDQKSEPAQ